MLACIMSLLQTAITDSGPEQGAVQAGERRGDGAEPRAGEHHGPDRDPQVGDGGARQQHDGRLAAGQHPQESVPRPPGDPRHGREDRGAGAHRHAGQAQGQVQHAARLPQRRQRAEAVPSQLLILGL